LLPGAGVPGFDGELLELLVLPPQPAMIIRRAARQARRIVRQLRICMKVLVMPWEQEREVVE
jgi:hypothetical protein